MRKNNQEQRSKWLHLVAAVGLAAVTLFSTGCDVDQTREAELPDVDVDVDVDADPGQLPAFDVDWASVDVGTQTKMVQVPKVIVVMEEVEVEVPYLDVNMPGEDAGEREQRTVVVEAEIANEMHDLRIQEVYAKGKTMMVISTLEPTGEDLGDNDRVRVSDRIVLNAPDLDVRHYIVGAKPDGDWNSQYRFVGARGDLDSRLEGATKIYSR